MNSAEERKLRLAVLISGGGTNLQAMLDRSAAGTLEAEVAVVLSDQSEAFGLKRAERAGIPALHIDYKSCADSPVEQAERFVDLADLDRRQKIIKNPDRSERLARLARLVLAERELALRIEAFRPDYVCLAGFMRLLSPYFIGHMNSEGPKIINIHPALLPAFPGRSGYEDTFQYGCKWGGVTVHFVDEGEDTGPIIAQAVYPVWPGEDIEKIRNRGLSLEYEVYPQVINWLAAGHVAMKAGADGRPRVEISDPDYAAIVAGWVLKVL
jgi:phosphoribosylglycinamide formyltransferase-1